MRGQEQLLEAPAWQVISQRDPRGLELADRHYSRRRPGASQIGGPFRKLVLLSREEDALWLSAWPEASRALDGLDAWRCQLFRNEGPRLSSELIREAMALTAELWAPARPPDGWLTWVDRGAIRSSNPGFCFLAAGWRRDPAWRSPRLPGRLVRLR